MYLSHREARLEQLRETPCGCWAMTPRRAKSSSTSTPTRRELWGAAEKSTEAHLPTCVPSASRRKMPYSAWDRHFASAREGNLCGSAGQPVGVGRSSRSLPPADPPPRGRSRASALFTSRGMLLTQLAISSFVSSLRHPQCATPWGADPLRQAAAAAWRTRPGTVREDQDRRGFLLVRKKHAAGGQHAHHLLGDLGRSLSTSLSASLVHRHGAHLGDGGALDVRGPGSKIRQLRRHVGGPHDGQQVSPGRPVTGPICTLPEMMNVERSPGSPFGEQRCARAGSRRCIFLGQRGYRVGSTPWKIPRPWQDLVPFALL